MSKVTLEIFNEKFFQLESFGFVRALLDQPNAVTIQVPDGKENLEASESDDEATAAFTTIYRQCIQDNDAISIRNIAKIYRSPQIPRGLRDEFSKHRGAITDFLDADASGFQLIQGAISNRTLIDTFIYGGWSGSTGAKRKKFEGWRRNEALFERQTASFNAALARVLKGIQAIADLNARTVPHL